MILSSLRGSSVLTVSDTGEFFDAGGMNQFLSENGHVRFAINVDATSQAKLKLSSKLLSLARVVGGNGKEAGNWTELCSSRIAILQGPREYLFEPFIRTPAKFQSSLRGGRTEGRSGMGRSGFDG